jgi:hypothetical protein
MQVTVLANMNCTVMSLLCKVGQLSGVSVAGSGELDLDALRGHTLLGDIYLRDGLCWVQASYNLFELAGVSIGVCLSEPPVWSCGTPRNVVQFLNMLKSVFQLCW